MIRHILAAAVAAVVCTSPLFALDVITRKSDGKKVSGSITDMSKNEITLKKNIGGDSETIPANDVAAIEWDGAGPDLRLGYSDENAEKFETALAHYNKAKADAKSPSENLKAEFDYVIARVNARQAMSDSSRQADAAKQLQAAQKLRPDHFRYYESIVLLGKLQLAMGDFDAARGTFDQLAKAPWPDYKLAARIASGRILVAENKLDEAIKEFEAVAAAATDSPADQARKYEAMLGQARALIAQKKYEDSLQILEVVTEKGPADEAAIQAEAKVLQGNSLQALGRMKEAALSYLYVDLMFPRENAYHAEALYNLVKTWKQVQSPERSADAEAKLVQNYPNSLWRKKLEGQP